MNNIFSLFLKESINEAEGDEKFLVFYFNQTELDHPIFHCWYSDIEKCKSYINEHIKKYHKLEDFSDSDAKEVNIGYHIVRLEEGGFFDEDSPNVVFSKIKVLSN